jgi:hypothetical protein
MSWKAMMCSETTKVSHSARDTIQSYEKDIHLLAAIALFAACEQKQTTVNPSAEKKESNTMVVKPLAEKKESQTTVINQPPATETKKEKTEVNIGTSPCLW